MTAQQYILSHNNINNHFISILDYAIQSSSVYHDKNIANDVWRHQFCATNLMEWLIE